MAWLWDPVDTELKAPTISPARSLLKSSRLSSPLCLTQVVFIIL